MNSDFEQIIDKLIRAIEENRACTEVKFEKENNLLNLIHSTFSNELNEFYRYLDEHNLLDKNYIENSKKIANKEVHELTYDEIMTILTSTIRTERFCDGYMLDFIKSGKMVECLKKIKMM